MRIEHETPDRVGAIRALHLLALPTAGEADLVNRLRRDGDVAISLVAVEEKAVVGHIMVSPMRAPFKAFGLGPVVVAPGRQWQGIGTRLVRSGLEQARAEGWEAVLVVGDPGYYGRFGFSAAAAGGFASHYAGPYFMALSLCGSELPVRTGSVDYAPAFGDLE
ncbi:MAG: N-acetyltransferase [Hyphomicrobium sp.]|nr:N-acetyltransferase [Hyphomicrobium sp.]